MWPASPSAGPTSAFAADEASFAPAGCWQLRGSVAIIAKRLTIAFAPTWPGFKPSLAFITTAGLDAAVAATGLSARPSDFDPQRLDFRIKRRVACQQQAEGAVVEAWLPFAAGMPRLLKQGHSKSCYCGWR